MAPTSISKALVVTTLVLNLPIELLIFHNPLANPCGPAYSMDPLSKTFVL